MKHKSSSKDFTSKVTSSKQLDFDLPPAQQRYATLKSEAAEIASFTTGHPSSIGSAKSDRLFVPLAAQPFEWFIRGLKKWELRRHGRQYTRRHVRIGREVEFRRGYKGPDALWGVIVDVVEADSITAFFRKVSFHEVIPVANSIDEAVKISTDILRVPAETPVLGFAVADLSRRGVEMTTLPLAADLVPLVLSGRKTSTVRLGLRDYKKGNAALVSKGAKIDIEITDITFTKVSDLTDAIAKRDGYETITDLLAALRHFYPDLSEERDVTIIGFRKNELD